MSTHFTFDNPALLASILDGEAIYLGPAQALEGLSEEHAHAKPHGLPHSIAEIVAHMSFWQEWFNACAETGFTGLPEHAAGGWPAPSGSWPDVRERYLQSLDATKRLAAARKSLDQPLLPEGVDIPPLARESLGSGLLHGAVHGSHHLGQIITMRQLLGSWPPPAGSMTW